MGNNEFVKLCKNAVRVHVAESKIKPYKAYGLMSDTMYDVYVVWLSRVIQNNKALLATTIEDGMYYECTLNGDKQELYLDVYEKKKNQLIDLNNLADLQDLKTDHIRVNFD